MTEWNTDNVPSSGTCMLDLLNNVSSWRDDHPGSVYTPWNYHNKIKSPEIYFSSCFFHFIFRKERFLFFDQ
jgi:hypothetical protein